MKRILSSLLITCHLSLATLFLLPPLAVVTGCTAGCASGKGTLNPATGVYDTAAEADKLVVSVEKTAAIAAETFRAFMQFERANEVALASTPQMHAAAEEVREHGKQWLLDLDAAKVAYQSNRTLSGKANLQQILAVVQVALASALGYMTTK